MSDLLPCPYCGVKGIPIKNSSAKTHTFPHKTNCFLFGYVYIQDYQFKSWNKRYNLNIRENHD